MKKLPKLHKDKPMLCLPEDYKHGYFSCRNYFTIHFLKECFSCTKYPNPDNISNACLPMSLHPNKINCILHIIKKKYLTKTLLTSLQTYHLECPCRSCIIKCLCEKECEKKYKHYLRFIDLSVFIDISTKSLYDHKMIIAYNYIIGLQKMFDYKVPHNWFNMYQNRDNFHEYRKQDS